MNFATVILAGGQGTRIGGNKPLLMLAGQSLVQRALDRAAPWSARLAIAIRNEEQIGDCNVPLIYDDPAIEGPLAGLVSGLRFGKGTGCEAILSIPADMPFAPRDLADRLANEMGDGRAAISSSGGHLHPVCGLWRVSALEEVDAYVASGKRSLRGFAEAVGFREVEWPVENFDPFFNINTPEDLATAEAMLSARSRES